MSDTPEKKPLSPMRFVCKGLRFVYADKDLYVVLARVDHEPDKGEALDRLYKFGKTTKIFGAGFVYEIEANDTQISSSTAKMIRECGADADRDEWRAKTIAAKASLEDYKRIVKAKGQDAEIVALAPIRRAWRDATPAGKIAIEFAVLKFIRG